MRWGPRGRCRDGGRGRLHSIFVGRSKGFRKQPVTVSTVPIILLVALTTVAIHFRFSCLPILVASRPDQPINQSIYISLYRSSILGANLNPVVFETTDPATMSNKMWEVSKVAPFCPTCC